MMMQPPAGDPNAFLASLGALGPGGGMPGADDPVVLPPDPPPQPQLPMVPLSPPPHLSELDRWAQRKFGTAADQLEGDDLRELLTQVRKWAEYDRTYWAPRNRRMLSDQDCYDLLQPITDEQEAQNAEVLVLPDPRLYVDKITNMVAGGDWSHDVPARSVGNTDAAQKSKNFLRWWKEAQRSRWMRRPNASPMRDKAHYAILRGWVCSLLLPHPQDPRFPWVYEIEEPLYVYPRYSSNGLIHVTRQMPISVMEARDEYPEAGELLGDYEDDETVYVIGYYDETYRVLILDGIADENAAVAEAKPGSAAMIVRPLRHGCRDYYGEPLVPWIITTPLGSPSRGNLVDRGRSGQTASPTRRSGGRSGSAGNTERIGAGILYAMQGVYREVNKFASMLATLLAQTVDPPTMRYIDPGNPNTEPLNLGPGGQNYAAFNREKVEIMQLGPNPSVLTPILDILQDRLQKGTLPAVFYGNSGSVTSGYGVNLLAQGAQDILLPYLDALAIHEEMVLQRVLETTKQMHDDGLLGPLEIIGQQGGQRMMDMFDPAVIAESGVTVKVVYKDITPQDKAAAIQSEMAAVQGKFHSRWTAMKATGVDDPQQEMIRIIIDAAIDADPNAAAILAPWAEQMSDVEWVQAYVYLKQQMQQQAMMAQPQQGPQQTGQPGPPGAAPPPGPGMPSQVVAPPMQVGPNGGGALPAAQSFPAHVRAGVNQTIATLSGGSLPRPQ